MLNLVILESAIHLLICVRFGCHYNLYPSIYLVNHLLRNVPLQACMHKVPTASLERGSRWPEMWPDRLKKPPYWLLNSQTGVYGKPAAADFIVDYQHWKRVVTKSYLNGIGINWSAVRNAMDMRAIYGG